MRQVRAALRKMAPMGVRFLIRIRSCTGQITQEARGERRPRMHMERPAVAVAEDMTPKEETEGMWTVPPVEAVEGAVAESPEDKEAVDTGMAAMAMEPAAEADTSSRHTTMVHTAAEEPEGARSPNCRETETTHLAVQELPVASK